MLAVTPLSAVLATPAFAAASFEATSQDWVVATNASALHHVPPGGKFAYCASEDITAITPSITYRGAPVGKAYIERVIGPAAAGTITLSETRNVDNDITPLKFVAPTGSWGNTYAPLSFPGTVHKPTLPPGTYSFEAVLGGKVIAKTSVTLSSRPGC